MKLLLYRIRTVTNAEGLPAIETHRQRIIENLGKEIRRVRTAGG